MIVNGPIESTRNYNNIGIEFLNDGKKQTIASHFVFIISQTRLSIVFSIQFIHDETSFPSDIHVKKLTFALPNVLWKHRFIIRIKFKLVRSMERHKKDLVVFVKLFLSSISVMNVPVENTNSFALFFCNFCSYCSVVE